MRAEKHLLKFTRQVWKKLEAFGSQWFMSKVLFTPLNPVGLDLLVFFFTTIAAIMEIYFRVRAEQPRIIIPMSYVFDIFKKCTASIIWNLGRFSEFFLMHCSVEIIAKVVIFLHIW